MNKVYFNVCVTSCIQKTLRCEDIFANLMQTLTSETKVLNPKECGVLGRSPSGGGGVWQFFLAHGVHIYMKEAEYDETNEKSIFRFLVFEIMSFLY